MKYVLWHPVALRRELFHELRSSGLRPGQVITKKMLSFEFGQADRLLWELSDSARNIFLPMSWRDRLEREGFAFEVRPYKEGVKDGGRHSALSRRGAFGDEDCVVLRMDGAGDLRRLLDLLLQSGSELKLDPKAVARWID